MMTGLVMAGNVFFHHPPFDWRFEIITLEPPVDHPPSSDRSTAPGHERLELDLALRQLEAGHGSGETCTALTLLRNSPRLSADKDSVLELIYAEYVALEESGLNSPIEAWYREFPQWKVDLDELFQVDRFLNRSSLSTIDDEAGESHRTLKAQRLPRLERFDIQDRIGSGASGVVYRARQLDLGRWVAVKFLSVADIGFEEHRVRFQSEAEAIAKLQHAHIVQVFEVDTTGESPYLVMECVSGGTLADQIKRQLFSPQTAARFLEIVSRAVHYAHTHGVVHRDLKPANILLADSDRPEAVDFSESADSAAQRYEPKISDFGIAKHGNPASGITIAGTVFGTPSYMAPEQAAGGSADSTAAVDIYSLGAMLYEMLTGRPPFRAATVSATLEQVCRNDPLPVRRLQSQVPRDLETICMKCLRKEPEKRYPSALALADDLRRFIDGRPILARPTGVLESCLKWAIRHPARATLLVTVFASLFGLSWLWRRAEENRIAAVDNAQQAESARSAEALERKRLELTVYAHDVSLAHFEYLNGNTSRADELLHSCPDKLRNWEWKFVDDRCHEPVAEFRGFEREMRAVAISPDGSLVAGASGTWGFDDPGEIRVFDVRNRQLKWRLQHPSGPIMDIEFDPLGRRLISSGTSFGSKTPGGVIVWDLRTGQQQSVLPGANAHSIAFSPDGQHFLVGHVTGLISRHQSDTGRSLTERNDAHVGLVLDLDYRADGQLFLSTGREGQVSIWKSDTLEQVATVSNLGDVRRGDFSPDGNTLAVTTFSGDLRVYRIEGDKLVQTARFARGARSGALAYAPDGQSLAMSALNQSLRLVHPETGQVFHEFHGHLGYQSDVDFSANGRWMVTAGGGFKGGLTLWDRSRDTGEWTGVLDRPFLAKLAYLPDGKHLAIAYSRNTSFPDQQAERAAKLFDVRTRRIVRTFSGHTGWLTSVAVDPLGRWLLTGSDDRSMRLWEVHNGQSLHEWKSFPESVVDVAFARGGESAIAAGRDGQIQAFDCLSGQSQQIWTSDRPVAQIAVCPVRYAFATLHDSEIQIWNDRSQDCVSRVSCPDRRVKSLQWSPKGDWLALGRDDATIELWRVDSQDHVGSSPAMRLLGHIGAIRDLAFSHDGSRLFSTSIDRTVKCWDLFSGLEVLSFSGVGLAGMTSHLAVDPTGKQMAFADANLLKIWSLRDKSQSSADEFDAVIRWHQSEYENARQMGQWFAMLFHWKQASLLKSQPVAPATVPESDRPAAEKKSPEIQ